MKTLNPSAILTSVLTVFFLTPSSTFAKPEFQLSDLKKNGVWGALVPIETCMTSSHVGNSPIVAVDLSTHEDQVVIGPISSNNKSANSMEIYVPIKLKNGPWTSQRNHVAHNMWDTSWKSKGKGTKEFNETTLSFISNIKSTFLTSGHALKSVQLSETGKSHFTLSYSYRKLGFFKDKAYYSFSNCKFKFKDVYYHNGVPVLPYSTDY